jgi:hypothetical protein
MRPGLEEWFKQETDELLDKQTPHAVRILKLSRLIQLQEGCVRNYEDGTIGSPINPEDVKDSKEYLERLRQVIIPL